MVYILLAIIAILLWRIYVTVDSFNEDLKQLRILVGHLERHVSQFTNDDENRMQVGHTSHHSINSIQKNEMCELLMIDPETAERIIAARPYESLEQIQEKVENIPDALMTKISNCCTL